MNVYFIEVKYFVVTKLFIEAIEADLKTPEADLESIKF